jgi:hypothetical protein
MYKRGGPLQQSELASVFEKNGKEVAIETLANEPLPRAKVFKDITLVI